VFFYLGSQPGLTIAEQYAGQSFTPGERALTQFRVLMYYLGLLAFPYPDRLSLEHTFAISHSLTDPISTLIAAASVLALVIIALRIARRHPVLSLCIMWFLVTLSIESSFIGLELAFEHRLYLPMFAFALGLAYLFFLVPARYNATASALAVVFVVALAAASIARNLVWQDPAALWADAASKSPDSYRAQNNLGRVLVAQGKREQAARAFDEAIRINPRYPEPHNNLATLHAQAGRFEQALAHFAVAIELNPGYAQAYNNLGVALLNQGRVHEATSKLAQAVRLAPKYAKAHANLAAALLPQAHIQAACRHYRMALELDPAVPVGRAVRDQCDPDSKTD
jgi:tetratricopeptide (TPR) repeat protein